MENQFAVMQNFYQKDEDQKVSSDTELILQEGSGNNFYFRDTTISGYENYSCYYLPDYKLKKGTCYKLIAQSGSATEQYSTAVNYFDPQFYVTDSIQVVTVPMVGKYYDKCYFFSYDVTNFYYNKFKVQIEYQIKYSGKIEKGSVEVHI